jgi:hypothetical protein
MRYFLFVLSVLVLLFFQISCTSENGATEPEGNDPDGAAADVELANQALADVLYALINSDGCKFFGSFRLVYICLCQRSV